MATLEQNVTSLQLSPDAHRRAQYKPTGMGLRQEGRRQQLLEDQRRRRRDLTSHARALAFSLGNLTDSDDDQNANGNGDGGNDAGAIPENSMEIALVRQERLSKIQRKERANQLLYSNQIMQSESFVEAPSDLEASWLATTCPTGQRCLVISAKGMTVCRDPTGTRIESFRSLLPGGSRASMSRSSDFCILDCIFEHATYHVLDMMAWNGMPFYDCDTEFRFFWKQMKLAERDVSTIGLVNERRFVNLQAVACTQSNLVPALNQNTPIIFLHKQSHYEIGWNPLSLVLTPDDAAGRQTLYAYLQM